MSVYDYDCEFAKTSPVIDLVSIGIVADDGREYYAISAECDRAELLANPWLLANVVPTLPLTRYNGTNGDFLTWDPDKPDYDKVKSRDQIAREVAAFVLGADHQASNQVPYVELWADYAAYDHVALCQLFGTMMDLPEGFPMWTHDIQQEAEHVLQAARERTDCGLGVPERLPQGVERLGLSDDDLPQQESGEHNALADARHNQAVRRWIADRKAALNHLSPQ